jgi:hypothetical protein
MIGGCSYMHHDCRVITIAPCRHFSLTAITEPGQGRQWPPITYRWAATAARGSSHCCRLTCLLLSTFGTRHTGVCLSLSTLAAAAAAAAAGTPAERPDGLHPRPPHMRPPARGGDGGNEGASANVQDGPAGSLRGGRVVRWGLAHGRPLQSKRCCSLLGHCASLLL